MRNDYELAGWIFHVDQAYKSKEGKIKVMKTHSTSLHAWPCDYSALRTTILYTSYTLYYLRKLYAFQGWG